MWRINIRKTIALLISIILMQVSAVVINAEEEVTIYTSDDGLYEYIISGEEAKIISSDIDIEGDIIIPSTLGGKPVTTIGEMAFYCRNSLSSVTISDSVKVIEASAFCESPNLVSFYIGSGVETIGERAFANCYYNESITVSSDNAYFSSSDGVLYNKDQTELIQYPAGKAGSLFTTPETVTAIGNFAFEQCYNIENVIISGSVKTIGNDAFFNTGLKSVTIPDSVISIGDSAFGANENLISVNIGNGTETIGSGAFSNCYVLSTVSIGNGLKSIGADAFQFSMALTDIEVSENNQYFTSVDGNLFNKDKTKIVAYAIGKPDISYVIPSGVTEVGDYAFCYAINLTNIVFPRSVTTIGRYAFFKCFGITNMIIPNKVTHIGDYAFEDCENLTKVTLPKSLISIGETVFLNCKNLTDICYSGDEEAWGSIDIVSGDLGTTGTSIKYNYKPYTTTKRTSFGLDKSFTIELTDVPVGSVVIFVATQGDEIVYQRKFTVDDAEPISFVGLVLIHDGAKVFVFEDMESIRPVTNVEILEY